MWDRKAKRARDVTEWRARPDAPLPARRTSRYISRSERESAVMNDLSIAESATHEAPQSLTQQWIDQRVFDLYDEYCHGRIDRREFLARASAIAGGLAMAQALMPRYAAAQTISFTDPRIKATYVTYPSPGGTSGTMRGYLVAPAGRGRTQPCWWCTRTAGSTPTSRTWRGAPRRKAFSRSRQTGCFRSAAIRATTTTAARCRPSSIRESCAPTC
jgi:hypothetical protein